MCQIWFRSDHRRDVYNAWKDTHTDTHTHTHTLLYRYRFSVHDNTRKQSHGWVPLSCCQQTGMSSNLDCNDNLSYFETIQSHTDARILLVQLVCTYLHTHAISLVNSHSLTQLRTRSHSLTQSPTPCMTFLTWISILLNSCISYTTVHHQPMTWLPELVSCRFVARLFWAESQQDVATGLLPCLDGPHVAAVLFIVQHCRQSHAGLYVTIYLSPSPFAILLSHILFVILEGACASTGLCVDVSSGVMI